MYCHPQLEAGSSLVLIPDVDFMAHSKFFDLQLALPFQCLHFLIQGLISLLNNSVFPLLSVIHRRHFCLKGENVALQFPSVFCVLFFSENQSLERHFNHLRWYLCWRHHLHLFCLFWPTSFSAALLSLLFLSLLLKLLLTAVLTLVLLFSFIRMQK